MRRLMTAMVGAMLASGLLTAAPAPAEAAQTHHLRSGVVSLGGEDRATLMGPDLLAGHVWFHQTFGECAVLDCNESGTWYVIDSDGSQLGGTYGGVATACLGHHGGDLVVNWGFGRYQGIRGRGSYSLTETYAAAACEGGVDPGALGWSGQLTLDVTY